MEWSFLFLVIFGVLGILIIITLFFKPVRILLKVLTCGIFGLVSLLVLNVFLDMLGWHIAVNPFTVFLAGFLKIPGIILLLICEYLFV